MKECKCFPPSNVPTTNASQVGMLGRYSIPVFREASTGGYRAYPGISRGRYRGLPSVPRYFERLVPGDIGRTPLFREAGTGGFRAYPGISRGQYRGVPSVPRYFTRPVPGSTGRTPVFREAIIGRHRAYPGTSQSPPAPERCPLYCLQPRKLRPACCS